jgi:hypothetical protein
VLPMSDFKEAQRLIDKAIANQFKVLDLSQLSITYVPSSIKNLDRLTQLILRRRFSIESLSFLTSLPNLTSLTSFIQKSKPTNREKIGYNA